MSPIHLNVQFDTTFTIMLKSRETDQFCRIPHFMALGCQRKFSPILENLSQSIQVREAVFQIRRSDSCLSLR